MITTITMNPCIDKTFVISGFSYGGMNRVLRKREDASGKGINVSAVLVQLGIPVYTTGLIYSKGEEEFLRLLGSTGIEYQAVRAEGVLRENIKLMDEKTNITTELNQKGDFIGEEKLLEFEALLEQKMGKIEILVVNGSVPQGVRTDYYRHLIEKARQRGIRVILDAEGELLLRGIEARPFLIKPNLYEFEAAFGLKDRKDRDEMLFLCRKIIEGGVEVICLSLGEEGALIADRESAFFCAPLRTKIKSTQGAGDSMVAGICAAMREGGGIDTMLRYGAAAAQGSLSREGTLLCRAEDFAYFKDLLEVKRL